MFAPSSRSAPAGVEPLEARRLMSAVVGRHVFYNHSAFDRNDAAANAADDAAIATDKLPLMPREAATFAHVTSYTRGINGVMVDVAGLPRGVTLTVDDFSTRTGRSATRAGWGAGPQPSQVAVRRGAGEDGSDRVTLVWADGNVVTDGWLEVTVKANANTGLTMPDVFAFGNLIGDTSRRAGAGTILSVTAADQAAVKRSLNTSSVVTSATDFNRDGRTNAADLLTARRNAGDTLPLARALPVELVTYNSPTPDQNGAARQSFYNAVGIAAPQHRVDFESLANGQNVSGVVGLFPGGLVLCDTGPSNQVTVRRGPGSISLSNPVGQAAVAHTPGTAADLVLDFSASPVDYVAFNDIDTTSNNSFITFTFAGGETVNFRPDGTLTTGDSAEFLGFFVAGQPRITHVTLNLGGDEFGIDNIEYGNVSWVDAVNGARGVD